MKTATSINTFSLEYLKENFMHDVNEGIEHIYSFKEEYPKKPSAPVLKKDHSQKELEIYSKEFETYQKEFLTYKALKEKYQEKDSKIRNIIEEWIKYSSSLYDVVPEKYWNKIYAMAWDDGHSSGYYEVYLCLSKLVDIFIEE